MLQDILGPAIKDSYYFQIVPLYLSLVGTDSILPAQGTTYRFSVHKGHHKFDENKHPIQARFSTNEGIPSMPVSVCKLNFYIPNYIKLKRQDFVLRMTQIQCKQDLQIGKHSIDAAQIIQQYKKTGKKVQEFKTFFSEDYQLDFQIYLEQSRPLLEELVKKGEVERMKKKPSPTRKIQNIKEEEEEIENKEVMPQVEMSMSEGENDEKLKETKQDNSASKAVRSQSAQFIFWQQDRPKKIFRTFSRDNSTLQNNLKDTSAHPSLLTQKVPLIHTKFKQLAKVDTPNQINMTDSQRLSSGISLSQMSQGENKMGKRIREQENEGNFAEWVYIAVVVVFIYFAMHPAATV